MNTLIKNKKIKRGIFILILFLTLLLPQEQPAEAVICWVLPCSGLYQVAYNIVYNGLLVKAKQKSAEFVNSTVRGSAAGTLITNWTNFLQKDPRKKATAAVNSYLTNTVAQGKSSLNNYVSKNTANTIRISQNNTNYEGIGSNSFVNGMAQKDSSFIGTATASTYNLSDVAALQKNNTADNTDSIMRQYIQMAKEATSEKKTPTTTIVDLSKSNANNIFGNMGTYFKEDSNNSPMAMALSADALYREKMEALKKEAEVIGIAGNGFKPETNANGDVTRTGLTTLTALSNAEKIGNDMIASAQNIPVTIATALVTQASSSASSSIDKYATEASNEIKKKTAGINELAGKVNSTTSKYTTTASNNNSNNNDKT